MADIVYVFGDILTGAIIQEISLQGVSMTRNFGGGDFRGTFNYDQTGKSNEDLDAATKVGRCYVICLRESTPIWGGIVWTNTYQSQSKTAQLYCKSFEHYPERRNLLEDFVRVDIEQRNIFLDLWELMQGDPNSIQVSLPASFTPSVVLKSIEALGDERKNFRQLMDTIADGEDGFDWTIDITESGGQFNKVLRIGYPTLGALPGHGTVTFDYPGSITNYWLNETMGSSATHILGIGAGEGSLMLKSQVTHTDLLDGGFPRYDLIRSHKDISLQANLDQITSAEARVYKAPMGIYTVETKADISPMFGEYGLGDVVLLSINDPKHPNGVEFQTRLFGWEYYPPSDDSVEMVRLTVEEEAAAEA